MLIQIGQKNQMPFWRGSVEKVPDVYRTQVTDAVELYHKESDNPLQSRTYRMRLDGRSIVVYVQEEQRPRRDRIC